MVDIAERTIEDTKELENILRSADVGRLGMCCNGEPSIIPVNFAYEEGVIYFHGSGSGLKTELLQRNPRVCFEVDEFFGVVPASVPCEYDAGYRTVAAYGTAHVLSNPEEKTLPLRLIVAKYADRKTAESLTEAMVEGYHSSRGRDTVVVKIQIDRMTGKRSIERPSDL
jgi:hypothetical protein